MLHAVVMAGGSGTRFWPQSRKSMPKQLLKLAGDQTMIQATVGRCAPTISDTCTWVVTNAVQAEEALRQLPELDSDRVLVEPLGRDTAPCVGLAAIHLLHRDPDAVMFVMPADHVIREKELFQQALNEAARLVQEDSSRLILFGIPPQFPATGYGYIERGDVLADRSPPSFRVESFREKPEREVAQQYVDAGSYYWNCGIFCWSARTIVDAILEHEPEVHAMLAQIGDSIGTDSYAGTLASVFPKIKSISIDYAVLERASNVCVIEAPFDWDDVGSWLAVPRLNGADTDGNTIDGPHCGLKTKNCIVRTTDDHVVATLGMEDCIIVHTPDATLVAKRDDAESIKQLLKQLDASGHGRLL